MTSMDTLSAPIELDHVCRNCYYSLRGNSTQQCPECGTPYNARDRRTYFDRQHVIRIREVGRAQKLLIWAVLASVIGWLFLPLLLIAIPFQLYAVFRLSRANGNGIVLTILLLLAMFIPLLSLIVLLAINGRATSLLREAGIPVGLMGARTDALPNIAISD